MAYNEDELRQVLQSTPYDSNKAGSYQQNATNAWTTYLNQLSPTQLLDRYSFLSGNGVNDLGSYEAQKYGFGNAADIGNYSAYKAFKDLFGRDPNANEFSQILPAFQGPNGTMNGRAALANLQNQYKSNPTLDPTSASNNLKPADVQSQVTQQFQSILGRAPTADELSHFSQAIQSNQTDAYGLSSFLKQQPEYTNAKDAQFRSGLSNELQGYDTKFFDKAKEDVLSRYAQNGTLGSSALDYALTDLMGKIADNRSQYLAGLSASQYGSNKDLAIGNYQKTLDQLYNTNQQQQQSQNAYGQQLTNQGFAGADYQTQMNDYMNFLNNQPRSKSLNPIYGAIGGTVGAIGGGFAGGHGNPAAIGTGYQIGQSVGNSYGYLYS